MARGAISPFDGLAKSILGSAEDISNRTSELLVLRISNSWEEGSDGWKTKDCGAKVNGSFSCINVDLSFSPSLDTKNGLKGKGRARKKSAGVNVTQVNKGNQPRTRVGTVPSIATFIFRTFSFVHDTQLLGDTSSE
jgi:hypothetical protein